MRQIGLLAVFCALATAGGKPGETVKWSKSWDDAVTEARALNLPLVVHRHGFY